MQGGPGTGKTVVGLHRVSWLLFNRRDRLEARRRPDRRAQPRVRALHLVRPALARRRRRGAAPAAVARAPGAHRARRPARPAAAEGRPAAAAPDPAGPAPPPAGRGHDRSSSPSRAAGSSSTGGASPPGRASSPGGPHNEAHRMLRAFLVAEAGAALTGRRRRRRGDRGAGRVGPRASTTTSTGCGPASPRRRSSSSCCRRAASCWRAGAGTLSEAELDLLALPTDAQVGTWQWSVDDVPLLDAADALLNGVRRHLRAHRGRRGAGPVAAAARVDPAAVARRVDHRARRPRPGHQPVGAPSPGTRSSGACATSGSRPTTVELELRLPAARRGPRGGHAAAAGGRPGPGPAPGRCAARGTTWRSRRRRTRTTWSARTVAAIGERPAAASWA